MKLEYRVKEVSGCFSFRQVLIKLKLKVCSGNYSTLKSIVEKNNIDVSHFLGSPQKGISKNRPNFIATAEILSNKKEFNNSNKLRKRLIKEKILENFCSICGISDWVGKSLTLHLDHINGNKKDNSISNLRILCPNCHSQTETYCRKK